MRLQDDLDFTTLNWVKQELDETLKQARQALEAYVEDPADSSLMRFCATYLHQVQGTLRMVELYGAAMVVEEMERVAQALLENQVAQKDDAYGVLMRGIVQLPDYLERLQGGHKDIPIVLLPLLNDLRSARGEKLLSESVLFSPDLTQPLPTIAGGPDRAVPELELKALAGRLRMNFQTGLLQWIKGQNGNEPVAGLLNSLEKLRALTFEPEARRLWWVAAGALEGVQAGGIEANAAVKQLFGKVDREIKRLADAGEASFRNDQPRELTKNLLYYVAHATTDSDLVRGLKATYKLEAFAPSEKELEHAKGALAGRNRALLDTVSQAIKEDLMRVKDALDLHLRTQNARPSDLQSQTEVLDRVADTLGMLGLGVPRRVVQEQRTILQDVSNATRPADEGTLLDIAGALLYVEASLDENIRSLGASSDAAAGDASKPVDIELPQAEVRRILEALIKEAQANLTQTKQDIVAFVESPWDHEKVTNIPKLLAEISGAMRMLSLPEPADLVHALGRFVEVELLRLKRVPTSEQMDKLADSLASIEYYLEASLDQRSGRDRILEVTRQSLGALGYWPLPAEDEYEAEAEVVAEATVAAPVVAETPVVEAPVAAHAPVDRFIEQPSTPMAAESMDLGTLTFDTETSSPQRSFAGELEPAEALDMSAIDLPSDGVDTSIERLDRAEQTQAAEFEAPTFARTQEPMHELSSVVEIGEGNDLSSLMLGEPAKSAVERPTPADIAGMRFAETEAATSEQSDSDDDYEWIEIEEEVEIDAPVSAASDASFQAVPSDDIDDEIREVFVEEVAEEIENIRRQLPMWSRDRSDFEQLKPIRRSFHTLKGSGRLVGALALGEFSWKVENMLNRVLDKTIQPGQAVTSLLENAVAVLPEMLEALRGGGAPKADVGQIMTVADQIAAGEDAYVRAAEKQIVRQIRRERVRKVRPVETPVELTQTFDITQPLEAEVAAEESASTSMPFDAALMGAPIPVLDPMLLEILRSEVEGHLATISEYVATSEYAPQPIPESVLRAIHTMHGAISMADVPVVTEVVGPLEGYIKRLRGTGMAPSREGFDAIRESAALIGTVVSTLDQPGAQLPPSHHLAARLAQLRDTLPEPESAFSVFNLAMEDDADEPVAATPVASFEDASAEEEITIGDALVAESESATLDEPLVVETTDDLVTETEFSFETEEQADDAAFAFEAQTPEAEAPIAFEAETIEAPLSFEGETLESAEAPISFETEMLEASDAMEAFDAEPLTIETLASLEAEEAAEESDSIAELDEAIDATNRELAEAVEAEEAALEDAPRPEEPVELSAPVADEFIEAPLPEVSAFTVAEDEFDFIADAPLAAEVDAALAAVGAADVQREAEAEQTVAEETSETTAAAEELPSFDSELVSEADEAATPFELVEAEFADATEEPVDQAALEEAVLETAGDDIEAFEIIESESLVEPVAANDVIGEEIAAAAAAYAAPQREAAPIADDPDPDAPLVLVDMDEDLIEIFVEEGNDILDKADPLVARLREAPADQAANDGLRRHLHTMKGNARAVGLNGIGDLAHAIESLLEAVASDHLSLDRVGLESLERGFDKMHRMVARVARRQAVGVPVNMIARFEALVAGESFDVAPIAETTEAVDTGAVVAFDASQDVVETEASSAVPVAEAAKVEAPKAPKPPRELRPLNEPVVEEEVQIRAPQEMIRVRSDLLDALVNFAGEVSIYRSRLEQQMGTFKFNLVELDQTVLRLRDQLRKLEIETEAQIIARYQREAETHASEFDPLELDRFSTLQQYSRALAESVSDLQSLQNALDDQTRQAETLLLQQSRVSSELQEGLMRTRMVPFDSVVPFLRRLMRQTSDELGKRASLRIEGAQGEMDRNLLERMKAPFEHMLRNALAHGVESPAERREAGKPEEGQVRIQVSREATEVVIRVTDDGQGMDRDRIRAKAIERGLMRPDAQLSDRDLFGFVLETGFSTAEQVTKIAGRGVGMDVVASEIKQLGGSLAIDSQRGKGTTFTIRLPFTLAVTQAILVRLGEAVYAIPMSSVQGVARIARSDFEQRLLSPNPIFGYAGEEYVLNELSMLLGIPHHRSAEEGQLPLLLIRSGDSRAAIHVDTVMGSREIVVKSVGPQVSSVPGIFGATIMGDGSVIMILDLAPLVRRAAALREEVAAEYARDIVRDAAPVQEERRQPLVMVVDDSITMRKVTSRVLERNDMEVITAKDGLDAVEKLQERIPDLMLLDIEMPRMDGYELATYMRNDSRLKGVPIIMITSRTGEKHRQRAFEIGVDRYLGKPYQETDLLRNVDEILKLVRA